MNKYYSLATSDREANINIYGDITSWPWMESDVSSYNLSKEIDGLDVDIINVYINSYGGEVAEGWAIYNALKRHKAKVRTVCDGFAASIAGVIFMVGDERVMSDPSLLFVHNAWTYAAGNANDFRKTAKDLETISQMSKKVFMEHVSITEEELDKLLDDESYITPQDALDKGFATAIVVVEQSKNPSQSIRNKIIQQLTKPVETPKEPTTPPAHTPEPEQNNLKSFLAGFKTC